MEGIPTHLSRTFPSLFVAFFAICTPTNRRLTSLRSCRRSWRWYNHRPSPRHPSNEALHHNSHIHPSENCRRI